MNEILKFPKLMEVKSQQEYSQAVQEHNANLLIADATKKVQKASLKKAVTDGGDAQAIAAEMSKAGEAEPTRRRYIVNDATIEKLGVILNENPNGVLIFQDEIIAMLRMMDREGHEGDRSFYLTCWAGDSRFTCDRIGRGTLDIEAACVSIVGSIQPGVVNNYLSEAVAGGAGDDGLLQRFQVTVWPDQPTGAWVNIDRYPNADAKAKAYKALQGLVDLTSITAEAEHDTYDRVAIPFVRFNPLAQQDFDQWRMELETRLRSDEEHPAIESHLAKYRSLIPSLALIIHLLEGGVGQVSVDALSKAIGWGKYLESHARRLYAGVTESSAIAARALAHRIQRGDVTNPFAPRDIYRSGWSGLDKERTTSAIDVLISLDWLDERIEPTNGKPRTRYAINPKIPVTPRERTDKADNTPFGSNVTEEYAA